MIQMYSTWENKRTGREVIVLDVNSSWIRIKGIETGKRSHVSADRFEREYIQVGQKGKDNATN